MEKKQPRVGVYARVSTDMQAEEGHSIAAQLHEMQEFAAARGWQITAEFVDPGISGSSMQRPALQELLDAVRENQIDIVLVHETSRLSRSVFDTFRILDVLGEHGVGYASVKERDFDFTTPSGRFFLTMISAMNQYYLDILKQHTKKGKRERARKGLYNASILPYGYRHTKGSDNPPEIDPAEAAAVKLAFESYATGNYSFQEVADRLNQNGFRTRAGRRFSKDTIDDMLQNRFYLGKIVYGPAGKSEQPEIFDGQHPAIISEDLFDAVIAARKRRRGHIRSYQNDKETYLLNAISACSLCGRSLRAQKTKTGRYYREMSGARGFVDCPNAQKGVNAETVEAQIEAIVRRLSLPADWKDELDELLAQEETVDFAVLNNRRARLLAEKKRLRDLYIAGFYADDLEAFKAAMAPIQKELDNLPTVDYRTLEEAATTLAAIDEVWDEAEMIEKRDIIRLIFRRIEIDVRRRRITALIPHVSFLPLFRTADHLYEVEPGRFIPLWTPDVAAKLGANNVRPPLETPPDPAESPLFPLIVDLPAPSPRQRITPVVSDFLRAWKKSASPLGRMVEMVVPGVPPLRVDERKWPEAVISRIPAGGEPTLSAGDVSFLHTPFLLQDSPRREAWLSTARAALMNGGWWVLAERVPVEMRGHWLYRYFPAVRTLDERRTLTAQGLYTALRQHGFTADITLRTEYRAVSYAAALTMARRREASPLLRALDDAAYDAGLAQLAADLDTHGAHTLMPSEVTVAHIIARRN